MGWGFRKSKKIGGVRLSLGKKSGSASVGGKWFRYTVNSRGRTTTTFGIPGTGLRWSSRSKSPRQPRGSRSASVYQSPSYDVQAANTAAGSTVLGCLAVLAAMIVVPVFGCCGLGMVVAMLSPPPIKTTQSQPLQEIEPETAAEPVAYEPLSFEPPAVEPATEMEPAEVPESTVIFVNEPEYRLRKWTDNSGKHTTLATLVSVAEVTVTLRKEDGTLATLLLERLSEFDRQYVDAMVEQTLNAN
jgi:hypothetical protein